MYKKLLGWLLVILGFGGVIANVVGMIRGMDVLSLLPSTAISLILLFIGYRVVYADRVRDRNSGQFKY